MAFFFFFLALYIIPVAEVWPITTPSPQTRSVCAHPALDHCWDLEKKVQLSEAWRSPGLGFRV
jgi:hypothetical protein